MGQTLEYMDDAILRAEKQRKLAQDLVNQLVEAKSFIINVERRRMSVSRNLGSWTWLIISNFRVSHL
jgi:hypothetical protein